jgi:hypothetical protein
LADGRRQEANDLLNSFEIKLRAEMQALRTEGCVCAHYTSGKRLPAASFISSQL